MYTVKKLFKVSPFELGLWLTSITAIILSFFLFRNSNYLYLAASLIGATALIFLAKGNVVGQVFMLAFNIMYMIISLSYHYYGELFNSIALSTPICIATIVAWFRHPYKGNVAEVKVNNLRPTEYVQMACVGVIVACISNVVLRYFDTANIVLSTIAVFTSFVAAFLTFRRSAFYAIAYAIDDCIIITLWILAAMENIEYVSMAICFAVFLLNDTYGFINWTRLHKKQQKGI